MTEAPPSSAVPPPPLRQDNGGNGLGARLTDDLVMALRFYSRLPTGGRPHELPNLSRITLALPFASLVIGIGPALAMLLLAAIGLPPLLAATLGVVLQVLVTGAMAEDALADAMDGLFGGQTIERRLEIMKDSRIGSYGGIALGLALLMRWSALATLLGAGACGLALIPAILSRAAMGLVMAALPNARAGGLAADGRAGLCALAPALLISAVTRQRPSGAGVHSCATSTSSDFMPLRQFIGITGEPRRHALQSRTDIVDRGAGTGQFVRRAGFFAQLLNTGQHS